MQGIEHEYAVEASVRVPPGVDAFETYIRSGLELIGVSVTDPEIEIMRYVDGIYGEALRALEAADLSAVFAEPDLDPSRAPRG